MHIIPSPNPVLFKKAQPVKQISADLQLLVKHMAESLIEADNPKGIGLAAPQVGKSLRLFLVKIDPQSPLYVFINPTIVEKSVKMAESKEILEGCLSIPGVWGSVKRHETVKVRYMGLDAKEKEKTFGGLLSTVVQHEIDHLNGILFTHRVAEQRNKLYKTVKDDKGKEVFREIDL